MQKNKTRLNNKDKYSLLSMPYKIWLYIFALFPIIIMFILMFNKGEGIDFKDGLTFKNFAYLFDSTIIKSFYNSFKFSIITTIICLFFGYIISYTLYRSKIKNKYGILLLLILPMWTNILLRIEALSNIMQPHNIISNIFNITSFNLIGTNTAVVLGLVFTYLPFCILPIYTSLEKIEPSLLEAAEDLGMTDSKKFLFVTFPLSLKGVISGGIMIFLPCFSGFAIPKILGGGKIILIGNLIEQSFSEMNYGIGSILAILVLVIILGFIFLANKIDKDGELFL